jgi:hypothetical protein
LLSLLEPLGGENWVSGIYAVRWRLSGSGWGGTDTLLIEYSPDGGTNWTQLTNTVLASAGTYSWNVDGLPASPLYKIRLTCMQDGALTQTSGLFRVGSSISYYVNDNATTNDAYCSAVGSDGNNGLTPSTPKATVQAILDAYDLEAGDTVFVDTGTYTLTANITLGALDGGSASGLVTIKGSPHVSGTVINRNNTVSTSSYGIQVSAAYVRLDGLRVTQAYYGIHTYSATNSQVANCVLYANRTGVYSGPNAVTACLARDNTYAGIETSRNSTLTNNVVVRNTTYGVGYSDGGGGSTTILNNTIANNGSAEMYSYTVGTSVTFTFKNNVLAHSGAGACVNLSSSTMAAGTVWDYNCLWVMGGGAIGIYGGAPRATMGEWRTATGRDANSLNTDPLFVNDAGTDYHLTPGSPCIDAGSNESAPLSDFDGDFRPYNLLSDIGADEVGKPSTPVVDVTPSAPMTLDMLSCQVTTPTVISPGLTPQYQFSWSNGFDTVVHGPTVSTVDTLSANFTAKHQVWVCSVRGYDGYRFSDPGTDSTTILNTVPGPLTLAIPSEESNSANLRCSMTKSPDPDGDVTYSVQWYVRHLGSPGFQVWTGDVLTTNTLTQIDAADTLANDEWYCVVTSDDGEAAAQDTTSDPCHIVSGGIAPSFITLFVSGPVTITLGESIMVTGQILPTPFEPDKRARFFSTPPGGIETEFPEDVAYNASNGRFTRTFTPTEASQGRADWSTYAHWNGDAVYREADSDPVTFTVLKALPTVSLSLSASSAPMNFTQLTATATLSAAIPDALKPLLAGRTIRLFLKKPDASSVGPVVATTDANGVATFTAQSFVDAGIAFNAAGTWQFIAEFPGDNNFLTATSAPFDQPESVRLTIKDRAGYAILVLGKLDANAEGQAEHARTADFAYRAFRERGFATEDIFYLREGDAQPAPDIFVSDTTPTKAEVQSVIQTWARTKMNAAPAPLYVVFVDHGATDAFYVYSGAFDETRVISPTDLDGYFDTLEGQLNTQALSQPIVFVYGACHSGSFIPAVSAENRVVITSAGADEVSHRGTTDPDTGVRDGEVFVTELFRNARGGKTLKESFELASEKTEEYTATRSNDGTAELPQRALLDDNGDGAGSSRTALAFDTGYDGSTAHTLVLGYGVNAGDPVSWIEASQTRTLATGELMGQLEARAIPAPTTGDTAWIEVKTPAYLGGELAALDLPDFQQTVPMLRFDYESGISDLGAGTYRWSDFGTAFDAPGTYKVFYYIKDVDSGEVSTHILTTVFRSVPGNRPPTPVTQIYPNNAQSVYSTTFFAWTESTDPDGDGITYRVEIAEDSGFTTGLIVEDGIVGTLAQIGGLVDGTTYYWRVWPVDEYGLSPTTANVRTFTVDNNNPALPGSIVGRVRNILTLEPVVGATVTMTPGNLQWTTGTNGEYFFFQVTPGAYTVNVSATGYIGGSQLVSVFAGSSASADFLLTSQKPALTVSPEAHSISAAGGPLTFGVSNTGQGVMTYSTSIITGADWLSISSGASGGNSGTIHVTAAASNVTQPRTGRIRITALGIGGIAATSSPREVLIAQEAGADGVPPVITRLGSSPVNVEQHAVYTDAGATATDNLDGDITANVQAVSTVNTAAIGSYTVTYTVSDAGGNPATPVVRTVNVVAATHAEGTIGPGGGTVTRDGISVTILPGALSAPTLITIDRAAVGSPDLPDGVLAVLNGTSFDVGPDGLTAVGGGDLATITISYPDADQDGIVDATSIPETHLVVLHIDETTGDVTTLEGTVNTTANTVTVTADSFSVFVLAQSDDLPGVPLMPWAVAALTLVMLVSGQLLAKRSLHSSRQ